MSTAGTKTATVALEDKTASFKINLTALFTPALDKISNSAKGVIVTWSKINNAKSYNVYRKGPNDKSWVRVANVTGTSYVDKNVKKNVKYTYTVKAYNGSYNSAYHSGVTVKH